MKKEEKIIQSGILEKYVSGTASVRERREVEYWIEKSEVISQKLEQIQQKIEQEAFQYAVTPPSRVKKRLFAFLEDEFATSSFPSLVNNHTLSFWEQKVKNIEEPSTYENIYVHDLEDATFHTKVVWTKDRIPAEKHTHSEERFLVIRGSCKCKIGSRILHLHKGDFMEIPLNVTHEFSITSQEPAIFILQREKIA